MNIALLILCAALGGVVGYVVSMHVNTRVGRWEVAAYAPTGERYYTKLHVSRIYGKRVIKVCTPGNEDARIRLSRRGESPDRLKPSIEHMTRAAFRGVRA